MSWTPAFRNIWLQLAAFGTVRVFWSDAIEREWTSALIENRPGFNDQIERLVKVMQAEFPLARVVIDDFPVAAVLLPDPDDLHVVSLAGAAHGAIVTQNIADFPAHVLASLGVEVVTPDAALMALAARNEGGVLRAAKTIRERLKAPAMGAEEYAVSFARSGCPTFAAWLAERAAQI